MKPIEAKNELVYDTANTEEKYSNGNDDLFVAF